jgi:DnaJ-class molecular chaperone
VNQPPINEVNKKSCRNCGGTGTVFVVHENMADDKHSFANEPCPVCGGTGKIAVTVDEHRKDDKPQRLD